MTAALTIPMRDLGFDYDVELHGWHDGLAGFRTFNHQSNEQLEGGLGLGLDLVTQTEAGQAWLTSIPAPLLDITAPFAEHQYQMLWLAANCEPALQILLSRPVLLLLICEQCCVDNQQALAFCLLGQRQILSALGYHSSKAALKFIDKLTLTYQREADLLHVKRQLDVRFCHFSRFKHYQQINLNALSVDHMYPFFTGTPLGLDLAFNQQQGRSQLMAYLNDTLHMGITLGIFDPLQRVSQLSSISDLRQLHDRWVVERNEMELVKTRPQNADFAYPQLLTANGQIKPISHYDELVAEGREQGHCIAIYHQSIANGHYCAFKMAKPERMTIGIKITKTQPLMCEIDQIRGASNSMPSEQTREIVYQWFEQTKAQLKQRKAG
jgi:hypothetical protein